MVRDRFHGSHAELKQALAADGLSEEQLREQLLWQITALQFIDQRFREGVFVSDEEVQSYYDQHQAELRKQNPGATADTLQSKVRGLLEGERVNQNFTAWLEQARKRNRIKFAAEAFK
jgi:hypothetical protein